MAAFFIGFASWFVLWWFLVGKRGVLIVFVTLGLCSVGWSQTTAPIYGNPTTGELGLSPTADNFARVVIFNSGAYGTNTRAVQLFSFGSYMMGSDVGLNSYNAPYYQFVVWVDSSGRLAARVRSPGFGGSSSVAAYGDGQWHDCAPYFWWYAGSAPFNSAFYADLGVYNGTGPGTGVAALEGSIEFYVVIPNGVLMGGSGAPPSAPTTSPVGGESNSGGWIFDMGHLLFSDRGDDGKPVADDVASDSVPFPAVGGAVGAVKGQADVIGSGGFGGLKSMDWFEVPDLDQLDGSTAEFAFEMFLRSFLDWNAPDVSGVGGVDTWKLVVGGGDGMTGVLMFVFQAWGEATWRWHGVFLLLKIFNTCMVIFGMLAFSYVQLAWALGFRNPEMVVPPVPGGEV